MLHRRLQLGAAAIGVCAVALSVYWASADLNAGTDSLTYPASAPVNTNAAATPGRSLPDPSSFDVQLWYEQPPTPKPSAPPPVPKLDLLAITTMNEQPAAIIFDPAAESMSTLGIGGTLGPTTVSSIGVDRVECVAHGRSFTLILGEGNP